jgi:3',5'-nucleoside bisphosphate phosphatase
MKSKIVDLHCHSTASDGSLTPAQVIERAYFQGVDVLSLTDHDTTAGLQEARHAADKLGLALINGIEISANYKNQCLHIIGLNINPENQDLLTGIGNQQKVRSERALKIAEKLEKKRIFSSYEWVSTAAGNGEITRSHFANFLMTNHYVDSLQEAFDRYLGKGKPAYVPTVWAELAETVDWIRSAGGVAVMAHPMRYNLNANWMNRALSEFKQMGGQGMEVVVGRCNEGELRLSGDLAAKHKLHASVGSDFHTPDNQWLELGRLEKLPENLQPIWELF